jgi:hypothetical protein
VNCEERKEGGWELGQGRISGGIRRDGEEIIRKR